MRRELVVAAALSAVFLTAGLTAVFSSQPTDVSGLRQLAAPADVRVSGQVLNYTVEGGRVLLQLAGKDGFAVTAVIPHPVVARVAGPAFTFERTVVVEGRYLPANRTLQVSNILQGCHAAYTAPPGGG